MDSSIDDQIRLPNDMAEVLDEQDLMWLLARDFEIQEPLQSANPTPSDQPAPQGERLVSLYPH